jgi:uncharacterized protein YgiM (DUF1202 family)
MLYSFWRHENKTDTLESMNLLIAFLTGRKDRLTRKNLKTDAIVLSALILVIAVLGTIETNTKRLDDTQASASVIPSPIREHSSNAAPNPVTSASPSASTSASATETASPTPTPSASSPEPSSAASPAPTKDHESAAATAAAEPSVVKVAESEKTTPAPVTSPVVPAPSVPAPVAPVPVLPAPIVPFPSPVAPAPYPVTSIPSAQYRTTIHLNLRSGPGSQYGIIGDGVTGTTVTTTGRASDIWYEVSLRGQVGWMSSQYLQKVETGANSLASLQAFAGSKLGDANQLNCLVTLWNRESNWNSTAINPAFAPNKPAIPTYQAYGIAQAAPGSRMASFGPDWETNPRTQILWGLDYISGRYGTPCKALDHSYAVGWY